MNKKIANMIDHTILKATATKDDVVKLCNEAKEYGFFSVCINPANIELAKEELKGSDVKVCTVIGFPLGANTSAVKAFETKDAIAKGADEVDMVINIGALKDKNYELVYEDIKAVVDAANKEALVKVIIETCYLTDEEKIYLREIAPDRPNLIRLKSTMNRLFPHRLFDRFLLRRELTKGLNEYLGSDKDSATKFM